jgi:hypothetical protein
LRHTLDQLTTIERTTTLLLFSNHRYSFCSSTIEQKTIQQNTTWMELFCSLFIATPFVLLKRTKDYLDETCTSSILLFSSLALVLYCSVTHIYKAREGRNRATLFPLASSVFIHLISWLIPSPYAQPLMYFNLQHNKA